MNGLCAPALAVREMAAGEPHDAERDVVFFEQAQPSSKPVSTPTALTPISSTA
jgi:hypothetical protein